MKREIINLVATFVIVLTFAFALIEVVRIFYNLDSTSYMFGILIAVALEKLPIKLYNKIKNIKLKKKGN